MTPEFFIRKVCHDLRAPLRGMKEIPMWLEEDLQTYLEPIPEPISKLLTLMKTQASQLDVIVVGLSELVKIERTAPQPVTMIEDVVAAQQWPRELRRNFGTDRLPMEPDHVTLAVGHLVDNAFHHAHAAERTAELSITRGEGEFLITMRDYGDGLDDQYFERIFEPLYALKSRDEREAGGMGLAVVEKIAELYGGKCSVRANSDGVGLTFQMSIPRGDSTAS